MPNLSIWKFRCFGFRKCRRLGFRKLGLWREGENHRPSSAALLCEALHTRAANALDARERASLLVQSGFWLSQLGHLGFRVLVTQGVRFSQKPSSGRKWQKLWGSVAPWFLGGGFGV